MNKGYAAFCDADRWFYDAPYRRTEESYPAALAPVPEGWQTHRSGDWLALRPLDTELPSQGWKIHVSACLDNAESVLDRVHAYCVERRIAFKFVPSRYLLHIRNAKYADRAASGKFLTVYPADEEQCRRIAEDLDSLLAGEPGPYILSDLRWNDGPVHLRYGSFTLRHCYDEHGDLVPAVETPDSELVPDVRGPVFQPPAWLELPRSCARTWTGARPSPSRTSPTRSRRRCTSPTAAASTPAATPAPARPWCSRRPARSPGSPPTAPTR